ncbi:hypothetical protein A2160_03290 [Candidatus Beckwithbacteria bacterium RBG_13_42_9]|uniref:Rod shape-determining protein MreD n=1 Tax=Candidatus Beckwithbacteria bacterium RBG_13_42_9 TaxID=1797457 RepID=A0A1F5E9M2_9BACT|nr:MAG: hypothetical protein A2160_03290 [Candidatus Beckwithbacteria bacterium RBG_13_42_9]
MWLLFLILIFFSFLQATFLPINLTLILVLIWSLSQKELPLFWIFLTGLAVDLVIGLPIGLSSLTLLLMVCLLNLLRDNWVFWPVTLLLIFSSTTLFWFLQTRGLQFMPGLWTTILSVIVWRIFLWLGIVSRSEDKALTV